MNLQKKLTAIFLIVTLIPLLLVSLLGYTNMRETVLNVQQRSFEATADLRKTEIQDYFAGIRKEVRSAQESQEVRKYLPILYRQTEKSGAADYRQAIDFLTKETAGMMERREEIGDIIFVDSAGKIIFNKKQGIIGQPVGERFPIFGNLVFANSQKEIFVSGVYPRLDSADYGFLVGAPIYDFSDIFIGVVIFEFDAKKIYDIIQDRETLGETGEVLVVQRVAESAAKSVQKYSYDEKGGFVLFLNPLRFDPQAAFNRSVRIGESNSLPAQAAAQGKEESVFSLDYRGKEVLGVTRYLPENNWGLVVKIDLAELLAPVKAVARATIVFVSLVVLLTTLMVWLLSRRIASPILELTEVAKKIGQGNLNVKFNEKLASTQDETDVLAKTLASSTASLLDLYENLEKKVKERTEKLAQSEEKLKKLLAESEHANKLMVGRELKMVELKKQLENNKNENKS
ncbi:MAG: hypothetical protein PHD72_04510 [Patescibacteria group bacterium]|nr:hypothetical protein [Patescibacteria group bacterium]